MPKPPWWENLDDKIEEGPQTKKGSKIMIIIKWIIILAFAAGFFFFIVEMIKLGL